MGGGGELPVRHGNEYDDTDDDNKFVTASTCPRFNRQQKVARGATNASQGNVDVVGCQNRHGTLFPRPLMAPLQSHIHPNTINTPPAAFAAETLQPVTPSSNTHLHYHNMPCLPCDLSASKTRLLSTGLRNLHIRVCLHDLEAIFQTVLRIIALDVGNHEAGFRIQEPVFSSISHRPRPNGRVHRPRTVRVEPR